MSLGIYSMRNQVSITHKPTGITVSCNNNRHQFKNREQALKQLQARLRTPVLGFQEIKSYEFPDDVVWANDNEDYLVIGNKLR